MKIFPKAMGNNNVDNNMQANMQVNMQTIASLMQQHGFSIGDNMMQKGMAALPEPQRLGAGHVGTTPVTFAAAVPEVPALRDGPATESPQDSQTTESPQESPAKRPRLEGETPQGFLEAARRLYAPGPADLAVPPMPTADGLTGAPEPAPLPPPPLVKGPSKPKMLAAVKKTIAAKPNRMPHQPTHPKFPCFTWGEYKIYNGGPRAAYRVSSAPGSRDTKFFKSWADVCKHLQCS